MKNISELSSQEALAVTGGNFLINIPAAQIGSAIGLIASFVYARGMGKPALGAFVVLGSSFAGSWIGSFSKALLVEYFTEKSSSETEKSSSESMSE